MANLTVIPEVITKMIELVGGHFAHADPLVDVLDGPSVDDVGQDVVAIGISVDDNSLDSNFQTAGLRAEQETFDLVCMTRSWNGDADLAPRRERAFELYRAIAEIISSNPRLDRTVARARIMGVSYAPTRLPEGAIATVTFRVRIEAFTS